MPKTKIKLSETEQNKPISYDSQKETFATAKEIKSGAKSAASLESLSDDELKELVLKRYDLEPEHRIGIIDGREFTKAAIVEEIRAGTSMGLDAIRAERMIIAHILEALSKGEVE